MLKGAKLPVAAVTLPGSRKVNTVAVSLWPVSVVYPLSNSMVPVIIAAEAKPARTKRLIARNVWYKFFILASLYCQK